MWSRKDGRSPWWLQCGQPRRGSRS
jgi:hypothetical protein